MYLFPAALYRETTVSMLFPLQVSLMNTDQADGILMTQEYVF